MKLYQKFLILFFSFYSQSIFSYGLDDYTKDLETLNSEEKKIFFSSANKLKCPTCTGLSVLGSDSSFSMEIRRKAIELVKENKRGPEIKSFFVDRYGEWLLRAPPKKGIHLFLWFIPAALLALLVLLGLYVLRRKKKSSTQEKLDIEKIFEAELALFKDYNRS